MSFADQLDWYAKQEPWNDSVSLYLRKKANNGTPCIPNPVEFVERPDLFGTPIDPWMHMRPEEAQGLMDALWRAGLRPTEGSGSAGSLAATERHLADMKAVAFAALNKFGMNTNAKPSAVFGGPLR